MKKGRNKKRKHPKNHQQLKLEVSIKDLSKFDSDFLKENLHFSTVDKYGKDRNEGQETIGRTGIGLDLFEQVMTAITHEILNRCERSYIKAIPTYQINKFVVFAQSDMMKVWFISTDVIRDFINGAKFKVNYEGSLVEI